MPVNLNTLLSTLLASKTSQSNNPLYQTIFQLIKFAQETQDNLQAQIAKLNNVVFGTNPNNPSGGGVGLVTATYLTSTDQHVLLTQSRELINGSGIQFDDSVNNIRTVLNSETYHAIVGGI